MNIYLIIILLLIFYIFNVKSQEHFDRINKQPICEKELYNSRINIQNLYKKLMACEKQLSHRYI